MMPLLAEYGLVLVALVILLGELGIPTGIPAEVLLLLAGAHMVGSPAGLVLGIALVAVADIAGALGLHWLVTRGSRRLRGWLQRRTGRPLVAGGRVTPRAIFAIRCLPVVRVYAVLGSALTGVDRRTFLPAALPGSLIWAGAPMTLGYALRDHVAGIATAYPEGSALVMLLPPLAVGSLLALRRLRADVGGWRHMPVRPARLRTRLSLSTPVPLVRLPFSHAVVPVRITPDPHPGYRPYGR